MKKKILALILVLAALLAMACLFAGCGSSEGLEYTLNNDGTGYIVSNVKNEKNAEVVIPATYEGKPVVGIGSYAFSGCTGLSSIVIPDSVTSIGNSAFKNCASLASITIPENVTSIGNSAFENCTSLTSVTIGNSVITIGYSAFSGCTSLTDIVIPDSVTNIGQSAFARCNGLEKITIPFVGANKDGTGNTSFDYLFNYNIPASLRWVVITGGDIANHAFSCCSGLTTITISDGVTSIGYEAFYKCTSLTSVVIGNGVTSIGKEAFCKCTGLVSVTLGNSVTSIGDYAFADCTSLPSIIIPDNGTSIGDYAFSGCTKLHKITLPDSVISIGQDAFDNTGYCSNSANWEDGMLYIGNHLVDIHQMDFTIKEGTICIADYALHWGNSKTTHVTIPNSVTYIGNHACECYEKMTSLKIGNSVIAIGDCAFAYCTKLTSLTIPDSVKTIGAEAFFCCYKMTSATIGANVTEIGDRAFYNCGLTKITIPASVTSIGHEAFSGCWSLKEIYFQGTVEQWNAIEKGYYWDENIESYTIIYASGSGNSGGSSSGSGSGSPSEVTASTGFEFTLNAYGTAYTLTYVGDCRDTNMVIPSTYNGLPVTEIGNACFTDFPGLKTVVIQDGITRIDGFGECESLTTVTIPSSVTYIASCAFIECTKLTTINFEGTMAQWNAITKGAEWDSLTGNYTVHCSDGNISK